MKRRKLLSLGTIGGLGLALGSHRYLSWQFPLTYDNCPAIAPLNSSPQLRFVVLGDVGTGGKTQYRVARTLSCYSQINPFPLALLLGDNIYEYGEIEKIEATFELPYQQLLEQKVQFQAVLGNHDIKTNNGEDQLAYKLFNMQGRYYSFDRQNYMRRRSHLVLQCPHGGPISNHRVLEPKVIILYRWWQIYS